MGVNFFFASLRLCVRLLFYAFTLAQPKKRSDSAGVSRLFFRKTNRRDAELAERGNASNLELKLSHSIYQYYG